jgi:plasmid stabilization system protein ParE
MKAYKHSFHTAAADEYEQAFLWYQQQSISASEMFLIAVEETIQKICLGPYRYRNTYKKLREARLRKFPYSIIFLPGDTNQMIVIVSVFHHKRNPLKKYK